MFMWICAALFYALSPYMHSFKRQYYDPAFFHIRWHKSFNYYYGNAFSKTLAPRINDTLNQTLDETRATSYRDSGTYKGVYMKNSQFIHDLPEFFNDRLDKNIYENSVVDLMVAIWA